MSLPSRIAALEAATHADAPQVILVSWVAPDGNNPHRVAAEVGDRVIAEQEHGEGRDDFLARVEQILRADGTGTGVRVAFLRPAKS